MRRALMVCAIIGGAIAILAIPGAALAGGGCHGSMTEADATGEDQATVRMLDACFDASVVRVDPGTSVTFVHEDPGLVHNVGGTEWGFYGEMRTGDTFMATFDDAGVYPFACSYHPGMTGAIVVGDGYGAGTGWTVLNDPVEPVADAGDAAPVADAGVGSPLALLATGGLGVALGAAIAAGFLRARVSRGPAA